MQNVVRPTKLLQQKGPPFRKKKWLHINFFSVQGTVGIPTGSHPENRVGDRDFGKLSRTVSSVLKVPNEPGHFRARTRYP
jgi:hypothetical protein